MAYVELFLEEPIQAPPEHLLFSVPDNWQHPSCLLGETTMDATEAQKNHNNREDYMEEFRTLEQNWLREHLIECPPLSIGVEHATEGVVGPSSYMSKYVTLG